jgi:hypothetical protein
MPFLLPLPAWGSAVSFIYGEQVQAEASNQEAMAVTESMDEPNSKTEKLETAKEHRGKYQSCNRGTGSEHRPWKQNCRRFILLGYCFGSIACQQESKNKTSDLRVRCTVGQPPWRNVKLDYAQYIHFQIYWNKLDGLQCEGLFGGYQYIMQKRGANWGRKMCIQQELPTFSIFDILSRSWRSSGWDWRSPCCWSNGCVLACLFLNHVILSYVHKMSDTHILKKPTCTKFYCFASLCFHTEHADRVLDFRYALHIMHLFLFHSFVSLHVKAR